MLGKLFVLAGLGLGTYFGGKAAGLWGTALKPSPSPSPDPSPSPAPKPAPAPPAPPPGYTGPLPPFNLTYPGVGAWDTDSAYIGQYQGALTYLSAKLQRPTWDPKGVDGKYGPFTEAAVKAFQGDNGLTADGQAGTNTDQALDVALAMVPS